MVRLHTRCALALVAAVSLQFQDGSFAHTQCTARLPTISSLKTNFSPEELAFLTEILPKPTSDSVQTVRAEIRAPLHIPCQMKGFPHILTFQEHGMARDLAYLTITAVAQPPHVLLFDASDRLVRTIPIAPAWTAFQLRDLISEALVHS